MKIKVTVTKKKAEREELLRAQLALLDMFATCDSVFTEPDTLGKQKRQMSLGRIYRTWKDCRAVLDPEFDPKKHDMAMGFGAKRK